MVIVFDTYSLDNFRFTIYIAIIVSNNLKKALAKFFFKLHINVQCTCTSQPETKTNTLQKKSLDVHFTIKKKPRKGKWIRMITDQKVEKVYICK